MQKETEVEKSKDGFHFSDLVNGIDGNVLQSGRKWKKEKYSGILILKPKLFWKTTQEAICLKTESFIPHYK